MAQRKGVLAEIRAEGTLAAIDSAIVVERGEPGNPCDSHLEKRTIMLKSNAFVARCNGSCDRGAASHERVQNNPSA